LGLATMLNAQKHVVSRNLCWWQICFDNILLLRRNLILDKQLWAAFSSKTVRSNTGKERAEQAFSIKCFAMTKINNILKNIKMKTVIINCNYPLQYYW